MPLKFSMQTSHISIKINTNLKIIELYTFSEQALTLGLQHYSKFCFILLF